MQNILREKLIVKNEVVGKRYAENKSKQAGAELCRAQSSAKLISSYPLASNFMNWKFTYTISYIQTQ